MMTEEIRRVEREGCSSSFNDWRWQIQNSIKTIDDLKQQLPLSDDLNRWLLVNFKACTFPFSVTPYFVSLMTGDSGCPIFAQVITSSEELVSDDVSMRDPLGEDERQRVPHLVHRYPDRVLFLATDRCASYCRFCTRKRWVGQGPTPIKDQHQQAF